jgi:hypothetical protein
MRIPSEQQGGVTAARRVRIAAGPVTLEGDWCVPAGAVGLALFAHGSGSSRHSPRNQFVARVLQEAGTGTLLFDLLTREEEAIDARTGELRFDIGLLAQRLVTATRWGWATSGRARAGRRRCWPRRSWVR